MSAHDEVQACSLLCKLLVFLVADVRDGRNAGDVGGAADEIDGVLHSLHRVAELGALAWRRNAGRCLGGHANDGKAVLLEDVEWLDGLVDESWYPIALVILKLPFFGLS